MKKKVFFFLLLMALTLQTMAQTIKIEGTVTSKTDGEPLIGATVMEEGTKQATVTDFDGNFSLEVSQGAKIKFSYVGFQEQILTAQSVMNVMLDEDNQLEEVVVTGYQVQRKADLTGAVGVMDMKRPKSEGSNNILNSLQGRVPGVNVITDPAPGGNGTSIQIRGVSNFNGNNAPLYVIDGVATTSGINSLNPADIETMQVLKDASSASIYGARAANGVVIITTKSGKGGNLKVNVGYSANIQFVSKTHDMLNANEWGTVYYRAKMNSNQNPYNNFFTYDANGKAYLNQYVAGHEGEVGYELHDTNWQDRMYQTAWTHNLNASVSNSSDKGSAMFSANYITQDGVVKGSEYSRINVRLNSTYNISKYITVGENVMIAHWNNNSIGTGGNDKGIPGATMAQFPGLPLRQSDGSFSSNSIIGIDPNNPAHIVYNQRDNNEESWRIFGNAFIEIKPIKGLTLKSNLGYDHSQFDNDILGRKIKPTELASVSRAFGKGDNWTWTNTANYLGTFGKHTINGLLGVEAIGYNYSDFSAFRKDFRSEDKNFMVIGAGTGDQSNGGGKNAWGMFSMFGKADYNYADRYLFSLTLRHDATSRLGKTNNSGTFPALSAAWRLTEEDFWKKNDILTDVKLRLAWGQNGNSEIDPYSTYSTYALMNTGSYDLYGTGTSYTPGISVASTGNKDLKWETTTQFNIGADTRWLDSAIGLSADFYVKETKDMLTQPPVLSVAGLNALQWRNTGSMRNVGVELTVDYRSPQYGDFSWDGSFNIGHYKNKILKLNDSQKVIGDGLVRLIEGQPMGVFYGYVCDGIFQSKNDVYNHAKQQGADEGRLIYRDINGDGEITDADQCIIGDANSDFSLSLNLGARWKNFTLDMFFTGDFGFDIYNDTKKITDFFSFSHEVFNRGKGTLNAWSLENKGASIPAVSMVDNNNEMRNSTYFLQDGSYFKCKYIKIGYNVPEKICKKIATSSINVFAQLENVFTITKYDGLDPEIMRGGNGSRIDDGPYPRSRTVTMGVNVSF